MGYQNWHEDLESIGECLRNYHSTLTWHSNSLFIFDNLAILLVSILLELRTSCSIGQRSSQRISRIRVGVGLTFSWKVRPDKSDIQAR